MAKKKRRKVSKSASIRQYLTANPGAPTSDVISSLEKKGVKVTANDVSTIRWTMKKSEAANDLGNGRSGTEKKEAPAESKASTAKVNKSEAVRELLTSNPDLGPTAVSETLKARGIDVSPTHVSNIKFAMRSKSAVVAEAAPSGAADRLSVSALFAAKELVEKLGGIEQARHAINTLAQLAK